MLSDAAQRVSWKIDSNNLSIESHREVAE